MSLPDRLSAMSNRYHPKGGELAGELFTRYRPVLSGTAIQYLKKNATRWRFENGTAGADPVLPGVQYYYGFGDMSGVEGGDIFVGPPDHPVLQYLHYHNLTDMSLIRADRLGSFYTDLSTPYLTSVRYEWAPSAGVEAMFSGLISGQLDVQQKQICLWGWDPLLPHNQQVKGLRFLETDGAVTPNLRRWIVKACHYLKPLCYMLLEEE